MISGILKFMTVILFVLNYTFVKISMGHLESRKIRIAGGLKPYKRHDEKWFDRKEESPAEASSIFKKWYVKETYRMKLAGMDIEKYSVLLILMKIILPIVIITKEMISYENISIRGFAIFLLPIVTYEMMMRKSILKREMAFQKNAYKIYKYLLNQSLAGVKPSDCLKTLHHVVEDKFLKNRLLMMSVVYSRTMDIDLALLEFKDYYALPEVENLCIAIKQGIDTGENASVLMRQEEMMFKKYFNYIQMETDRQKLRALIVVTVFSFIMILMIGIPLFCELVLATESIFI